ncbi:MAG: transposase [Thermodesulfobacteriota bacterium]|nr:transposase [Thermodesulfobacteriota bacterium]
MVTVDVMTFIGRMVQHILPKGFHQIRYYGLQSTKTYKKWVQVIKEGLRRAGRIIKGTYEEVSSKRYRERFHEMSGRDPFVCRYNGQEMDLWRIWHPKYGTIYDEWEKLKAGKYEEAVASKEGVKGGGGYSLWSSAGGVQLPLLPVRM